MECYKYSTIARVVVFSSVFLAAACVADYPSGALQAVPCILSQSEPDDCSASPRGVKVPAYLVSAYDESPDFVHRALHSGGLRNLSNNEISSLPLILIYLIPRARLAGLRGTQLAAMLQQHSEDSSLAQQVVASLQDSERIAQFLYKLKDTALSQDVQEAIGDTLHKSDLTESFLKFLPFLQEPILAYVRAPVLFEMEDKDFFRLMVHLREVDTTKLPRGVLRVIAAAAIKRSQPSGKLDWLIEGLTPNEIKNENILTNPSSNSFKLKLTNLQARALFERVYDRTSLHQTHFIDSKPLLYRLSPMLLQRFPKREHKYSFATSVPPHLTLPTAIQICEYVIDDGQMTGKLIRGDERWDSRVKYLGVWAYTLPLHRLQQYLDSPLSKSALITIQSPKISPMQAYYFTGRGKALDVDAMSTITDLNTFLHALPASQLTGHRELNSVVKESLLANLPGDNLPRTLSLVQKVAANIGEQFIIEHLLKNKDINKYLTLVSPKDLKENAGSLLRFLESNVNVYGPIAREFPQPVLFTLLEEAKLNPKWSWSSLLDRNSINNYLVNALSCQLVEELETGLFIPVIAEYNRHRSKAFPKNLQQCCLKKLITELELKMRLSQADESRGLVSVLEPVEIESVGGYVLLELPVEVLKQSPYLGNILSAIGKLSNAELILAANMSHLQEIAKLAVDKEGNVDIFVAGNLYWFLPPGANTAELKLALEAGRLDTTICLPAEARRMVAANILKAFGPVEGWSSGDLVTLRDLLVVFLEEELRGVSRTPWTEAADSLSSRYSDDVEWILPTPFYKVCVSHLGSEEEREYVSAIAAYARFLLHAAQWQLSTVDTVSRPDQPIMRPISVDHKVMPAYDFAPERVTSVWGEPSTSTTTEEPEDEDSREEDEEEEDYDYSYEYKDSEKDISTAHSTTSEETTVKFEDSSKKKVEGITSEEKTTETTMVTTTIFASLPMKPTLNIQLNDQKLIDLISIKESQMEKSKFLYNTSIGNSETENVSESENIKDEFDNTTNINYGNPINMLNFTEGTSTLIESTTSNRTMQPSNKTININEGTVNENKTTNGSSWLNPLDKKKHESNTAENEKTSLNELNNNTIIGQNSSETKAQINTLHQKENTTFPSTTFSPLKVENDTIKNIKEILDVEKSETFENIPLNISIPHDAPVHGLTDNTIDENSIDEDSYSNSNDDLDKEYEYEDESQASIIHNSSQNSEYYARSRRSFEDFTFFSEENEESEGLSCNALRMVGQLSALALTRADIEEMGTEELLDCRTEWGAMDLTPRVQKEVWRRIDKTNKKEGTHLLGNLLQSAAVADTWELNFNVDQPWVLEAIHAFVKYTNSSVVLDKLLAEVHNNPASPELLAVLGSSVCSAEPDSLRSLPVTMLRQWPVSTPPQCPPCLSRLAQLAVDQLGSVALWTQHTVHALHGIVAGLTLDDWRTLISSSHKPLYGLQPAAISCLSDQHLQELGEEEVRQIPALTLELLPYETLTALNVSQVWSLNTTALLPTPVRPNPIMTIFTAGVPSGSATPSHLLSFCVPFLACFLLYLWCP